MLFGGLLWLRRQTVAYAAEGDGAQHIHEPIEFDVSHLPPLAVALAPVVTVIMANYVFSECLIPSWDTSYLADAEFGATSIDTLRSLWAMIAALMIASLVAMFLNLRRLRNLNQTLSAGATNSRLPTFNTGS